MRIMRAFLSCVMRYSLCVNFKVCKICVMRYMFLKFWYAHIPDLHRTPDSRPSKFRHAKECGLPGPMSRDDDEDSSPLTQDLDLAQHIPCSTRDLATEGHLSSTPLTLSPGASAHGSENYVRETPASPTATAKLTYAL